MKTRIALAVIAVLFASPVWADAPEIGGYQNTHEKENQSVVRNKKYFKSGKVELGVGFGLVPYDSTFDNKMIGAHLTWHINDHFGWQIIEYQKAFPTATTFTTSLVSNDTMDVVDLQAVKMNSAIGSNLIVSPLYGKIRLIGVVYLDIYLIAGLGVVNTSTMQYSHVDTTNTYTETTLNTGYDLALNYGVGFKFFANNAFAVNFDLRNYMAHSLAYNRRGFNSNFTASLGLSFFLPNFG